MSILEADWLGGREEEESPEGGAAPNKDDPDAELWDPVLDPELELFFAVGVGVPPSKDDPVLGVPPRRDDPDTEDFVSAVFA